MPEDFEPKPITPSDEFAMHGNPHAVSGQANETFLLKAGQGHVLGSGEKPKASPNISSPTIPFS